MTEPSRCTWCRAAFTPRADGGKAQRFCSPICRRAFDAAGRRWVAAALASGALTLDELRNRHPATRALVTEAISPMPVSAAQKPAPVASAPRAGDSQEALLDDLLIGLLQESDLWDRVAAALSDELFDRVDRYLDDRLSA